MVINRTPKHIFTAITLCGALGTVMLVRVFDAVAKQPGGGVSPANLYTVSATQALANNAFAPPLFPTLSA